MSAALQDVKVLNENNTIVITYCDGNYEENLEIDFVPSLRNRAGYKGRILVLDYGICNEVVSRLNKIFGVEFIHCRKFMPVYTQRYWDIPKAIDSLDDSVTNVMIIDGGDIWFQNSIMPIFDATIDKVGCVEEPEIFDMHEWTKKCMMNFDEDLRKLITDCCRGQHVKNSGMVSGPRELVSKLIYAVYQDIYNTGIEFFGIDQLFFNYRFMKMDSNLRTILDKEFNFVLVTNKDDFHVVNDDIYSSNNKLVTVVHNAGGAWRLLGRPFKNKKADYDQYVLENVKKIRET